MNSVLKYPGSKWRIADELVSLIPEHHSYLEPFFGSGAVLFRKPPSRIETINDLDSDVVNLFECIKEDADKLARLVYTTPYSREVYDRMFEKPPEDCKYEKALSFLVKCWQGHGFRTNGYKVGWKNDVQGRERAYALWNWNRLPMWILEIADRLKMVQIENRPAIELICRFDYENVFMYLDPPYMWKLRAGKQYKHEMDDSEHRMLLEVLQNTKAKVMISGYDSELYNKYLDGWNKKTFSSNAEYGGKRTEVVWMNYKTEVGQMSLF